MGRGSAAGVGAQGANCREPLSRSHRIPVERPVAESCLLSEQAARGGGVELGGGAAALLALARGAATPTDLAASEGICGGRRAKGKLGADKTVGSVLYSRDNVHI